MKRILSGLPVIAFLVSAATPALSATWYVKVDGSGDVPTIQVGVDSSANGDTVLVGAGTFTGVGNRNVRFNGKDIVVVSEFGAASTIIDCESAARGFFFNGDGGGVLRGFTITNGYTTGRGGGIYVNIASPEICYNVIVGNHAVAYGGGIALRRSSANVYNNTVVENSTDLSGGAVAVEFSGSPTIDANILGYSTAGEGIACIGAVTAVLSCNDIFGNAGGDAVCGTDAGGNASTDPTFCGFLGTGDVYLQAGSPCAPGVSACGQLVGALGIGCATVANQESTWGGIKALFED